ncbi:type II toxin-antitoxin system RelE/ParE family toxin [Amphiplicatus metriothermophilus]|uniref:Toxin n=1 Tax=Amphiplicatus metriothermophilus TaxID=1519374 RepID=A0A239PR49_9PROT|nr:type II toxin-antitoxin system RelE/ParE family toxin [Amphiplicatus metriothermophilus]MBB5518645.1 toxin ParE1/3/4 [Amphiplicatus metriothermophilus]SNT72197.1 toxin ParE1/3/4 [Amphiplicatus metriothermophilus]
MSRYVFSAQARADLDSVLSYTLEGWGARQAKTYLDALETRLQALAKTPSMGRARPDLAEGVLSFPSGSHVIYYKQIRGGIAVVRILHGRRDPSRHI